MRSIHLLNLQVEVLHGFATVGELPQLTVDNIVLGSKDIFQYLKEKVAVCWVN